MNRYDLTDRMILKTLTEDEAPLALAYALATRTFLAPYEPIRDDSFFTLDHQRRFLNAEQEAMDDLTHLRLWLFLKDGTIERPIGNFAFSNIIRGVFQNTFLGYKLDPNYINQGYMTEALNHGINIAFKEMALHRIEANIMPNNNASLALVRKLGFEEEGLAKKYLLINGKWEDHIHMVKLNTQL